MPNFFCAATGDGRTNKIKVMKTKIINKKLAYVLKNTLRKKVYKKIDT